MPVVCASHTPAHIAALLDAAIAQLPPLPDTTAMLCTSLPETTDAATHYIVLGTDPVMAGDARVSSIATPLPLAQLVTRIGAVAGAPTPVTLAGGWQFSPSARLLEHSAQAPVQLTELEAALLTHLAQHEGRDIARETLMRDIWRYDEATQTHTLETHMYRLRGKLEKLEPSACQIITTEAGYRLQLAAF